MTLLHISFGGPMRQIVDGKGKSWHFEDHPQFGPATTNRRGDIQATQPPELSPFWTAVTHWSQQGKHISTTGLCVWTTPPKQKTVCIGGSNYALEGSALALKYGEPATQPQGKPS